MPGSDWGENEGTFVIDDYQGTVTPTVDFTDGILRVASGAWATLSRSARTSAFFLDRS